MLDAEDPFLPYIAACYALAALTLCAIFFVQRQHYRKTRRHLEQFKDTV